MGNSNASAGGSNVPSKHIPERAWTALIMQNDGDADAAREDVKEAVCQKAGVEYERADQ